MAFVLNSNDRIYIETLRTTLLTVKLYCVLFFSSVSSHLLACTLPSSISIILIQFYPIEFHLFLPYSLPLIIRVVALISISILLYSTAPPHLCHLFSRISSTTTISHRVHLARDPAQLVVQKRAVSAMLANSVLEPSFRSVIASAMAGTVYGIVVLKLMWEWEGCMCGCNAEDMDDYSVCCRYSSVIQGSAV